MKSGRKLFNFKASKKIILIKYTPINESKVFFKINTELLTNIFCLDCFYLNTCDAQNIRCLFVSKVM